MRNHIAMLTPLLLFALYAWAATSEFGTLQSRAAANDADNVMQSEWRIAA